MDKLLQAANIAVRSNCPLDSPESDVTIFRRGSFLQLTFQTTGCKYNACGSCSMCNYGRGKKPNESSILTILNYVLEECKKTPTESILLGASGSFLDVNEIPEALQTAIMNLVYTSEIQNVIIETHYKSISIDALNRVVHCLPDRRIELEVGLETVNTWLRTHILNKDIDLSRFSDTISIAHRFNMTITANLLLGIPFLSEAAQIADTKESINWALLKGVDYIVVFPVNIHPYTLFEWLYMKGQINPISLWVLFFLLASLNDLQMKHLTISWYGNRSIYYSDNHKSIPLCACDSCRRILADFFDDFSQNKDLRHRRKAITRLEGLPMPCTCRDSVKKALESKPVFLTEEYESARHLLEGLISQNENP